MRISSWCILALLISAFKKPKEQSGQLTGPYCKPRFVHQLETSGRTTATTQRVRGNPFGKKLDPRPCNPKP